MNTACFRFYEELNDFLPSKRRKQAFNHNFKNNPSVKDVIESIGVPHTEIDLILVNGNSVDFSYKVMNGDVISVYPEFETLDIGGIQHLRSRPLRDTKFILDVHLSKLARYLRLLGFDSLCDQNMNDKEIIDEALKSRRIILSRDKMLLRNKRITHGYWIRSVRPGEQITEVISRFSLRNSFEPFTRCLECNGEIVPVMKESIIDRLPVKTALYYRSFSTCNDCGRIFWKGSHYSKMKKFISSLSFP